MLSGELKRISIMSPEYSEMGLKGLAFISNS